MVMVSATKNFHSGGLMLARACVARAVAALVLLFPLSLCSTALAAGPASPAAGEYSKHFHALSTLSVAVAQAMPPDEYGFCPHPESMNFGELMSHIATTTSSDTTSFDPVHPITTSSLLLHGVWRMSRTISYYVHEGWWDGQFTVALHRGDCIRCNGGKGQRVGSFLRRGKWHGPFENRSVAVKKLAAASSIMVRITCECTQSDPEHISS
jgi:hypothetical protein